MELENSSVSCCSSPSTQLPPASANDGTCAGNQLDNRLQVVIWLRENYMVGDAGSMRKSFVYQHYLDACRDSGLEGVPISHTFFGKLVRRAFPGIRCNRKGPRGDAHQCYTHLQRLPTAQRLAPGQVELITEELAKASGNTCGGGGGTSSPSRPRASSNRRSRSESHLLPSAIEGDESPGCSSSFSQPETPTDNNTTTYEEDYDEEEEGTLYEHYSSGPRGHDFPHRQGSSSTSSCCSPLSSPTSSTASYYEISSADMGASSTTTTPFSSTRASSFFCSSSPVSCNCSYHGFPAPPPPPLGLEAEPEHAPGGAAEEQIYHDDGDEEEEVPGGYSCLPLPLPRHHQYQHQQQSSLHLFPSFAGRVGRAGMMAAFDYTRLHHHQQQQQLQQLFSGAIGGGGGGGEGDHGVSTPPLYLEQQQQQPFSSFTSGVPSSWHTLPTGGSNNGSTASAYYVPTEQHNSSSSSFFAHHTYQQQQQHFEIPSPFYAINSGCDDDDSVDLEAAFSADLVGATAMAYPTTTTTTTTRLAAPLAHHHPTTLMADGSSAALVGDEATGAWPSSSSSAEMCGRSVEHPLWPAAWPDTIYS